MKKRDSDMLSSFFKHARPTAVVIIPIKNEEPVLIFKHLGAPFYRESSFGHNNKIAINDFKVYWKGKFLDHKFPNCIQEEHIGFFKMLIKNTFQTHQWGEDFPDGCLEMPIAILMKYDIQLRGTSILADARKILRKNNLLLERRGRIKTLPEFIRQRDAHIIKTYSELGSPQRIPMKKIMKTLRLLGGELFPKDEQQASKYDLSERQIRNVIEKFRQSKK
jgi:hypothetical protein